MESPRFKLKDWLWIFFSSALPLALDQMFKSLTSPLVLNPQVMGFFAFFYSFSDLQKSSAPDPLTFKLQSILWSTAGLFCLFVFLLLNFILIHKHLIIRASLAVFTGGVFSLIIDHIFFAKTINNIAIAALQRFYPFNLSILFILAGASVFFYFIITKKNFIFQKNNFRKHFILNNKNQNQFLIYTMTGFTLIYLAGAAFFAFYFSAGVYGFSSMESSAQTALQSFYLLIFLVYLFSAVSVFILALIFSHRIYGPVQGFQSYMRSLFEEEGKTKPFKTRSKDQFKELEKTAEYIRTRLLKKL